MQREPDDHRSLAGRHTLLVQRSSTLQRSTRRVERTGHRVDTRGFIALDAKDREHGVADELQHIAALSLNRADDRTERII